MFAPRLILLLSLAMLGVEEGPEHARAIHGLVIGPGRKPVADADILVTGGGDVPHSPTMMSRGRSDGEGRFLVRIPAEQSNCDRPTIWAIASNRVVGSSRIDHPTTELEPFRLRLGRSSPAAFVVAGPDGRPVAGATIKPRLIARANALVPREIADLCSKKTDIDGKLVLEGFRPEEIVSIEIETADFGRQIRDFRTSTGLADVGEKGIRLVAVGRVSGKIKGDDPTSLENLTVQVESSGVPGGSIVGLAELTTDATGHFVVPAIASGIVTIRARPREGIPDLPSRVIRRPLEAAQHLECEIPLQRGVRVSGLALDSLDGKPVPGVTVQVVPSGQAESSRVVTDAQGRYETFVPAGLVSHRILDVPSPYLCPPEFLGPRPVEAPAAIARFELPEIRLTRGSQLRGSVLDSRNQPVAGVTVEASWMLVEGRIRAPRSESTTTKNDGSFVLQTVAADTELSLKARKGEATTSQAISVRTSPDRTVVLQLTDPDGPVAGGVVRSGDGRAVAGALVRLWSLRKTLGGSIDAVEPVLFDGTGDLTTDEEGRFKTPGRLRNDREYRAIVSVPGSRSAQTAWLKLGSAEMASFPDLVLERAARLVAIEGRMVDRDGKPIAGVRVRTSTVGPSRQTVMSDANGRFRLENMADCPSFLFAEKDGFRFFGRTMEAATPSLEIRLIRINEPVTTAMTTRKLEPAGLGLARRVLAPYAEKVLTSGDQSTRLKTLELLAKVDPRRVLLLIESRIIEDPWLADHLRQSAAGSPVTEASSERKAIIDSIHDPECRVIGSLAAASELPGTATALKHEWIEKALADTRLIREPSRRVVAVSRVASRMIDLGLSERATRILEEIRPVVDSMPASTAGGRCRVEFAECLARQNPTEALRLTENLVDPGVFDRLRVRIALRMASTRPDEAAKILESLRDPRSILPMLPSLCHALGSINPEQARKLLGRVQSDDPCLAPYALGLMALAVSETDQIQATAWLRESFTKLTQAASGGGVSGSPKNAATVAAALLPVAEKVDPTLVPELFWWCVSMHDAGTGSNIRSDAVLALMLARYDLTVSRSFLEPLAATALLSGESDLAPVIAALAILDPDRAVKLVEALPEPSDLTFHQVKNGARLELVSALLRTAPGCWDHATIRFLKLSSQADPIAN